MGTSFLIGIAGGTGSGKTTVAKTIMDELNNENITLLQQDSYYKDQSDLEFEKRQIMIILLLLILIY